MLYETNEIICFSRGIRISKPFLSPCTRRYHNLQPAERNQLQSNENRFDPIFSLTRRVDALFVCSIVKNVVNPTILTVHDTLHYLQYLDDAELPIEVVRIE